MCESEKNLLTEIAEGEKWLAGFEKPAAPNELLLQIKQSIRGELLAGRMAPARSSSWKPWHGGLAAAASVGLCVCMAWYSTRFAPETPVELVQVSEPSIVEVELTAMLSALPEGDDDLTYLEESSSVAAWALDGSSLYEALEAAFDEDAPESGASRGSDSSALNGRIS